MINIINQNMFTIYWQTNIGIVYFDKNWQQTTKIEACILFKTKMQAEKEHFKHFGFIPNTILVEKK